MKIKDKNKDFFDDRKEDIEQAFDQLSSDNLEGLGDLINIQTMAYNLFHHEATRLSRHLGESDPRIKQFKENSKSSLNVIHGLKIEHDIAKIKTVDAPPKGALVHGRITDESSRGIPGITVKAENEKGETVPSFGTTQTNGLGYYAFQLKKSTLEELSKSEINLVLSTTPDKIIHRENKSIVLEPDAQQIVNITLNRDVIQPIKTPVYPAKEKKGTGDTDTTEEGKEKIIEISESEDILESDLEKLKGIGPKYAQQLRDAGIKNIDQFINIDDEKLKKILGEKIFKRIKKMNTPLKK